MVTGGLALLLFGRGSDARLRLTLRWERLRPALIYGASASLPILIWLVIDYALTGTVASRSGQLPEAYWQRFLAICPALEKIVPLAAARQQIRAPAGPLEDGAVVGSIDRDAGAGWLGCPPLIVDEARSSAQNSTMVAGHPIFVPGSAIRLAALLSLFIIIYLAVLAGVQVLTYPPVTLASRMLSPVHLAVIMLVFALLHLALRTLFADLRQMVFAAALLGAALLARRCAAHRWRTVITARASATTPPSGVNPARWQPCGPCRRMRR